MKMEILLEPASNKLIMKMEILLELALNKLMVGNLCDSIRIKLVTAGNPIKEILLKLNLPDHMSILMDSKIYIKLVMEVPGSS
ncbi:hypothetical protein Tco_0172007 [Tanacetum coccineum]